ncbi:MAG: hypothetical protein VX498_14695 [Myxococcota bacterium]|nr:hypothetical protein [Myxococcota bacterium]
MRSRLSQGTPGALRPIWAPLVVLGLAFVLATAAGPVRAADPEAVQQLRAAEAQLDDGDFSAALNSADTAFRLDPAAERSLVVKGLAYEALGRLAIAEAFLEAAMELSSSPGPDLLAALDRVRSALLADRQSRRRQHSVYTQRESEDAPGLAARLRHLVASSDLLGERVEGAVSEGRCALARAGSLEFTAGMPDSPRGYRLLGDALRCADRKRDALLAYRRHRELGGDDPGVASLIDGLASNLSELIVQVEQDSGTAVFRVWVSFGTQDLPGEFESDGRFRFSDLPAGEPITLRLAATGFASLTREVDLLAPGELREIQVAPEFIGLAEVELVAYDPKQYRVALVSADGRKPAPPGSLIRVTVGELAAEVTSEHGRLLAPLEAESDERLIFDPRVWSPSELTLVGIPVGAKVRIFVEGGDDAILEREVVVPLFPGETDSESGVRLAPPQKVSSLIGGSAGLFVNHPVLGSGNGSVVLAPGRVNATTFDWSGMSGVPEVRSRWKKWQDREGFLRGSGSRLPRVTLAVGVGTGIAAGLLWAATAVERRNYEGLREQALAAGPLSPDEWSLRDEERQRSAARERGFATGAILSSAVSVVGITVSSPLGARNQKQMEELGSWSMAPSVSATEEAESP